MPDQHQMDSAAEIRPFGTDGTELFVSRNHAFGLIIHGVAGQPSGDYLHETLLADETRAKFWDLVEREKLVVCKNLSTEHLTYRKVRGKSSKVKLSQAEYYHHDGCSCPTKPRVVEIRLPHQDVARTVPTAIAPFADVISAMLEALPTSLARGDEVTAICESYSQPREAWPPVEQWDSVQGKITRLVRKEMDADSCRAFFREVDRLANAYVAPWEMGESRLMLNNASDVSGTMQHRRAYQPIDQTALQNGSLVKRWPAEELEAVACNLPGPADV